MPPSAEARRLARMAREWNVNIHYDAWLAACVPARAAAVLAAVLGRGRLLPTHTICPAADAGEHAPTQPEGLAETPSIPVRHRRQ